MINFYPLKMKCFKVLPLVYDESLSYYEMLCKVVKYINDMAQNMNEFPDYVDDIVREHLSDEHLAEIINQFMSELELAISANNEHDHDNSSADYKVGQMLWLKGKLYKVIKDIYVGYTFVEGENIELTTFEVEFYDFTENIKHSISENDEHKSPYATKNYDKGSWIWIDNQLYIATRNLDSGDAFIFNEPDNNVKLFTVEKQTENIYTASDKKLTIHGKISDYESIVHGGDIHIYDANIEAIKIIEG